MPLRLSAEDNQPTVSSDIYHCKALFGLNIRRTLRTYSVPERVHLNSPPCCRHGLNAVVSSGDEYGVHSSYIRQCQGSNVVPQQAVLATKPSDECGEDVCDE